MDNQLVRNENVANKIAEGVELGASALERIKSAAIEFVELIPWDYESDQIPEIIKQGRALYKDDFNGDHNLSAWFGDCATLAMAGSAPVSFQNTKKEDMHTTAQDALKLSKHNLKSAAKAARDDIGIGRASGGGRSAKQPKNTGVQHVFSAIEFKSQLAGLFGNSQNPVKVLNDMLAEYHCEVTPIAERKPRAKRAA